MFRHLFLSASFLVAGAMPAFAQSHDRSHTPPYRHGPGHVVPDSATHAAIHGRLLGTWTGTLSSHHGVSRDMDLSIAHDSLHKVILATHSDRSIAAIIPTDVALKGDTLRWTQVVSGKTCRATSVLSAVTPRAAETLLGTFACEDGEIAFSLRKKRHDATSPSR